jgi:hypothetical protein
MSAAGFKHQAPPIPVMVIKSRPVISVSILSIFPVHGQTTKSAGKFAYCRLSESNSAAKFMHILEEFAIGAGWCYKLRVAMHPHVLNWRVTCYCICLCTASD